MNSTLIHSNALQSGSRFAANFDYKMHDYHLLKFQQLIQGLSCLELGCYHGEMTKKLSKVCSEVTALDFDSQCVETTIENCKQRANVSVVQGDFFDYQHYGDYDVIYFSHSLEHTKDDKELLDKIFSQMKEGAILITIVPNGTSLSRKIAVKMGIIESELVVTDFEKSIGHYRTYDMESFQKLFRSFDFQNIEFGGIMPKIFSNYQFDKSLEYNIIDDKFLDALFALSDEFCEICSSIYSVCTK